MAVVCGASTLIVISALANVMLVSCSSFFAGVGLLLFLVGCFWWQSGSFSYVGLLSSTFLLMCWSAARRRSGWTFCLASLGIVASWSYT